MDINSIMDKLGETARAVARKSNDLVELNKLRFTVSDIEDKIGMELKEIGRMVYEAYISDDEIDNSIKEKCEDVTALYNEIESIRAKIHEIKDIVSCPGCGAELPKNARFCSDCGEKV